MNWQQIGHILTRESQLPLENCRISGGIYAPTLRYHNGRFYMITTNTNIGGNFLVWAENILGPWSDPVWIDHDGIDPSLFWDEDGKVYYTGTWIDGADPQGIGQFEIDIETGAKLSETRIIWYGTGGRCPEDPAVPASPFSTLRNTITTSALQKRDTIPLYGFVSGLRIF